MADVKPISYKSGELEVFATGDTVAVAHGGTGASDQATARTNLGVAIGANVQAWDADLDALAALSTTGFSVRTAGNTWATRTLTQPVAGLTISNNDGVAGNPTFALANDLAALEGLSTTGIAVRTGSDAWTARSLATANVNRLTITNADGVAGNPTYDLAMLTNSGTGSFLKLDRDAYGRVSGTTAVVAGDITTLVDATYVNVSGDTMTGALTLAADPSSALHAATKQYVDAVAQGYAGSKASVKAATTGSNVNVAGAAPDVLDGVSLALNDLVLVKDQSTPSQNGIYSVTTVGTGSNGTWTRAVGYDTSAEVLPGLFVFVSEGTSLGDNGYTLTTNAPITLGTTGLTFTQTSGAGQIVPGAGLTKTGNTLDIGTASTSRIVVNADTLDLGQPTISGSGAASNITKITVDAYGRVTTTGTATPSDIGAQAADADLTALAALGSTGFAVRTAADTWAQRTLAQPVAGITITNSDGVAGNPTFALANDLSALEGLSGTGFAVRTNTDTWTPRSIATASASRITVSNGDGVSGNPTLDLASGVIAAPGTYNSVTVDTYGRVTAGSVGSSNVEATTTTLTNNQGSTINIAQAVFSNTSGNVQLARADAAGTKDVIGFVASSSIANSASGSIATSGTVTATTGEWDAVTGGSGGLVTNTKYYLSTTTAGNITSTAPATGWSVLVGIALSSTRLGLYKAHSIKL